MTLNELKLNNLDLHCNFITPPDQAPEALPSVLLVDSNWEEIEDIALWYKNGNCGVCYNVFLYQDSMWEPDWLDEISKTVDVIIVNTEESAITNTKMKYINDVRTWYYGPVKFKGSDRVVERPLDWFINNAK